MNGLKLPPCVISALLGGVELLRLSSRGGPRAHHGWPLLLMAVGLLLAGATLGVRISLFDPSQLCLHRGARLTLLGALTIGTTLALLGLLAALTTLL